MLRHLVRFLVRQRFRVYKQYPLATQTRIAYNALTLNRPFVQRRIPRLLDVADTSNGILQDRSECVEAEQAVLAAGLLPHYSRAKNWDFLKAFKLVAKNVPRDAPVLDAGCGPFSVLLEWLDAAGYPRLSACDYFVEREGLVGRIDYSRQDLTGTTYADDTFAAITCLSVIEHNVDVPRFLDEMRRILRPGGLLVVSTDYWPMKIDTTGVRPYGDDVGDTRILDEEELRSVVAQAESLGFQPLTPMQYGAKERTVHWAKIPESYTFAFVAFRLPGPTG